MFGNKRIYLDYASATPICKEAQAAVAAAYVHLGNPGAIHKEGVVATRVLEDARGTLALSLGCKSRELIFTSGATEGNVLAIVGLARALEQRRRSLKDTHWLVSAIEHPSVLESFAEVERMGGSVSFIQPNERGLFSAQQVAAALKKETVCISIGWANSEIGVVQSLSHIARAIRAHEKKHKRTIAFHTDAGQAPLYLPTTIKSLGVDLLTLDAAKLYGPHGTGLLYIGKNVQLASVLFGGGQERGLRPGTENVALACGFAAALARVEKVRDKESKRLRALRDAFAAALERDVAGVIINGDLKHALPHMLNISIPNIQSEYVTLALDHGGIAISTKSACREGEERESHVVKALGGVSWRAQNTLRFSLGETTNQKELKQVLRLLTKILK